MARIKTFKAVHPRELFQEEFPVSVINSFKNSKTKDNENSKSFLNIISPILKKSRVSKKILYGQVRDNYESAINNNILTEDAPSIYVYEQTEASGRIYKGIIALTFIEDYSKNLIKKHEKIVDNRRKLFTKYLDTVKIQSEPILLTYFENAKLELLMEHEIRSRAMLNFTDLNQVKHRVWRVENALKISQFKDALKRNEMLYIADGHHRIDATEKNAKINRKIDKDRTGNENYNFVMSYIVSSNSLKIQEYIRLVKDLNRLSKEEFLDKVSAVFNVNKKGSNLYYPSQKFHISMYLDGEFYSLYIKNENRSIPEGLGELDVYLLEKLLLKPILNIDSESNNSRMTYLKGNGDLKSAQKMKRKIDSKKYVLGFTFLPISFNDLKLISDLKLTMPPKSTYIEPKLLTGMLIYDMK